MTVELLGGAGLQACVTATPLLRALAPEVHPPRLKPPAIQRNIRSAKALRHPKAVFCPNAQR